MASTYDEARQRTVAFATNAGTPETWEWDGTSWLLAATGPGPGARFGTALAYDGIGRRVLLFGGGTATGPLDDTWSWDGRAWSRLTPSLSPPPRERHGMCFDAARGVVVLFGGSQRDDTWEWNGFQWQRRLPATSPEPRNGFGIAYDARRHVSVVFSGEGSPSGPCVFGVHCDTWEWDGTSWTRFAGQSPPGRYLSALAYDGSRQRVVLFGGDDLLKRDDLWEYDGTAWAESTERGPTGRYAHGFVYDGSRQVITMFGGVGRTGVLTDTWYYGVPSSGGSVVCWLQRVRTGTPSNPDALRCGGTPPFLGLVWNPRVDHRTFLPGAVADALFIAGAPANQPSPFGTVLCDLARPHAVLATVAGLPFQLPIPNSSALVGAFLYSQALSASATQLLLTNALDVTIGR